MLKFSPAQKAAVEDADRLAAILALEYETRTRATYKQILGRVAFRLSVEGTLPRQVVSTTGGAELRLEWHDNWSPDDSSGKAKVRVLFKKQPLTKPRFLTENKVALRQEFLAAWPELAAGLGELGEVVAQQRSDTLKVEQARHQGKLERQWTAWRDDQVTQNPRVLTLKKELARVEAETRQAAEAERENWEYVANERAI